MTTFLARRRRPARRPASYIVSVTNHWTVVDGEFRRDVLVRRPDGALVTRRVPDEHPALVRFLDRVSAVAA